MFQPLQRLLFPTYWIYRILGQKGLISVLISSYFQCCELLLPIYHPKVITRLIYCNVYNELMLLQGTINNIMYWKGFRHHRGIWNPLTIHQIWEINCFKMAWFWPFLGGKLPVYVKEMHVSLSKVVLWLIYLYRYTEYMLLEGLNNNILYWMCFSHYRACYFQPTEFTGY